MSMILHRHEVRGQQSQPSGYELATQAFTDKFQLNEMEGTTYN